jgi:hypothetical protein
MKKNVLIVIVCLASLAFLAGEAWGTAGTVSCVDNAADLQTALTTAQSNGTHDLIKVVQGTYSGHFTFSSDEGYSITLQGGYTAGCVSRVVNPANTILDGAHTGRVLYFYNVNSGQIQVDGFTIQNGSSFCGPGVYAYTYSGSGTAGDITLTNNIITGNSSTSSGAGGGVCAFADADSGIGGNVTLTNNTIQGNAAGGNGGGAYIESNTNTGTAGIVTLLDNTITGNTSTGANGGGVYVTSYSGVGTADAGKIILTSNTITGNTAGNYGGIAVITNSPSLSPTTPSRETRVRVTAQFSYTRLVTPSISTTISSGGIPYQLRISMLMVLQVLSTATTTTIRI